MVPFSIYCKVRCFFLNVLELKVYGCTGKSMVFCLIIVYVP